MHDCYNMSRHRSRAIRRGSTNDDAKRQELTGSGDVDALLIASPTPAHIDLIAAGVAAVLPVLCKKPIDLDIARVVALRPIVRASEVPVAIGFNRRIDPSFLDARPRSRGSGFGPSNNSPSSAVVPSPRPLTTSPSPGACSAT
jgi:predicted dehydrogenase